MNTGQATDIAATIAGDNPLFWALVIAVMALAAAIVVLWKAYLNRQAKIDEIAMKNVEVMTAFAAKMDAFKDAVERIQVSCNSVWSNKR